MGRIRKEYYSTEFKEKQLFYYTGLPEKQQRYFLGMESERLGSGSRTYLSEIFTCGRKRIIEGCKELELLRQSNELPDYTRQRKAGGGAKKKKLPTRI